MTDRTTIVLPKETRDRVQKLASARGKSMATFIREAVDEKLERERPKPRAIGVFDSGHEDTAEKAGDWKFEPRTWRS